jgi:uncharacterized protein
MKFSNYNFLFKSEKYGYLLYNSLSNGFAELDQETYLKFEKFKNSPEIITKSCTRKEINQLSNAKILVENDNDEYLKIKLQRHLKRFDKKHMTLTIAPTLHCNFTCNYCFEESRPNIYMTDKIEKSLIDFITRHQDVERLTITWFGGEPLLSFNKISSITDKINSLGINYNSTIITNGYLMSPEIISQFLNLRIDKIHVTIDGPEKVHNKRRPHINNKGSFQTIFQNLVSLKPYLSENKINLTVRVNIDHSNKQHYNDIYTKLRNEFGYSNVSIYPGIVKKTFGSCKSVDDILMNNQEQANFNIDQYQKHNINSADFFPVRVVGECMARQIYGYLVDARGDIYKCWTDVGNKKEAIGNILDDTLVNTTKLTQYLTGADAFDKPKCQKCFFLPVCGGGCPHIALKNLYESNSTNLCLIAKNNLEQFLEIYYEIKALKKAII